MDHIGMDVHKKESQICILAGGGEPFDGRAGVAQGVGGGRGRPRRGVTSSRNRWGRPPDAFNAAYAPRAYLINDIREVRPEWFEGVTRVGITAGASTPEFLVMEAVEALRRQRPMEVREVHVVDEDVRFGLPHELEEIARDTGSTLPPRVATTAQGR